LNFCSGGGWKTEYEGGVLQGAPDVGVRDGCDRLGEKARTSLEILSWKKEEKEDAREESEEE